MKTEKIVLKNGVIIEPVEARNRLSFMPRYFVNDYSRAENTLYKIADKMLSGYTGGYWNFSVVKLLDGFKFPLFVFKSVNNQSTLTNIFSGEQVTVDDTLAGIILTIYTGNYLDNDNGYTIAGNLTTLAYDYAEETGQSKQAWRMLD